jgi:hypothetical protein
MASRTKTPPRLAEAEKFEQAELCDPEVHSPYSALRLTFPMPVPDSFHVAVYESPGFPTFPWVSLP